MLSLGKRLVESLDETDFLSRWMAHYLAQQIEELAPLHGKARASAEAKVAALVLDIWANRRGARLRDHPTELIESVHRALARLDPERPAWSYYSVFDEEAGPRDVDIETNQLLKAALGLDRAAGDLVRVLLRHAATLAAQADADWIQSLAAAGVDPLVELGDLLARGPDLSSEAEKSDVETTTGELAQRAAKLIEYLSPIAALTDPAEEKPESRKRGRPAREGD